MWAAALTLYYGPYSDTSPVQYAPPSGASSPGSIFQGTALPVPQDCVASNFHVMVVGATSGGSATFSLRSYNERDGIVPTGITCTVTAGTTGTGTCTSPTSGTLYFNNTVALQVDTNTLGGSYSGPERVKPSAAVSDNEYPTATVSFVCR